MKCVVCGSEGAVRVESKMTGTVLVLCGKCIEALNGSFRFVEVRVPRGIVCPLCGSQMKAVRHRVLQRGPVGYFVCDECDSEVRVSIGGNV
ncbi:hypothetical protein B6U83_00115 [Thermoplasmatales archaeon ex4484_36]|nr:MAG: hypothetical protein B6U83_00115 [Thermoplasmatales archaeon ex4484_36]